MSQLGRNGCAICDGGRAIGIIKSAAAGLAGYVITGGVAHSQAPMNRMHTGMVDINSLAISAPEIPFGGMGVSGFGAQGGVEDLQAGRELKLVSLAT